MNIGEKVDLGAKYKKAIPMPEIVLRQIHVGLDDEIFEPAIRVLIEGLTKLDQN